MSYDQAKWTCLSLPSCPAGKSAWPELVGKKGGEAKAVIERERPDITGAIFVPQGAFVTDDYCCNRVRIILDGSAGADLANAIVAAVPVIG
ncbi:inhibitor of trypsin and hageman factor-like [Oryza brachyantha]|uniref:inhibitor of trypsin and hageman factor-like n=1 Tax=Oryza brachyantha TaxID=4533 RepID=UPI0007761238|nr:inhibitor of trypsin and hageman factor-like [Oryza brachyantha]